MNPALTHFDHVEFIKKRGWDLDLDEHLSAMGMGLVSLGHRYCIARVGDDWQVGWTWRGGAEIWGMRLPSMRRALVDATKRVWSASRGSDEVNGDPPPNPRLPYVTVHHRFAATTAPWTTYVEGERALLNRGDENPCPRTPPSAAP